MYMMRAHNLGLKIVSLIISFFMILIYLSSNNFCHFHGRIAGFVKQYCCVHSFLLHLWLPVTEIILLSISGTINEYVTNVN